MVGWDVRDAASVDEGISSSFLDLNGSFSVRVRTVIGVASVIRGEVV